MLWGNELDLSATSSSSGSSSSDSNAGGDRSGGSGGTAAAGAEAAAQRGTSTHAHGLPWPTADDAPRLRYLDLRGNSGLGDDEQEAIEAAFGGQIPSHALCLD